MILYADCVVLGRSLTHHCLVVDLDHLIPWMDLLTLICWRLQKQGMKDRKDNRDKFRRVTEAAESLLLQSESA